MENEMVSNVFQQLLVEQQMTNQWIETLFAFGVALLWIFVLYKLLTKGV